MRQSLVHALAPPALRHERARSSRTAVVLAVLALTAIALAWSASAWRAPIRWTSDGFFYEAQSHEVTGTNAPAARREVFFGRLGGSMLDPTGRLHDHRFIDYSAAFYRRRWVAPIAAAAIRPVAGDRSLLDVSLLGYLLSGLGAFFLLRRRFGCVSAFITAVAVLAFQPLRTWSAYPLTDSLGVAALFDCLLAGWRAQSGSRWRLLVWCASVALLAFTRDAAAIAAVAAVGYALTARSRRAIEVALTGLLAATPGALVFGAPLRATIAFTFTGNQVPDHTSWSFILHRYPAYLSWMLRTDFPVVDCLPLIAATLGAIALLALPRGSSRSSRLRAAVAAVLAAVVASEFVFKSGLGKHALGLTPGVMLLVGLVPLFLRAGENDTLIRFARGGAVAAVAFVLVLPEWTGVRLGLVLLPFAAVGLARTLNLWAEVLAVPARSQHDSWPVPAPVPS